jgi:hypothetical protein
MSKSTLRHSKTQAQELSPASKKLLAKTLFPEEIKIIGVAVAAERRGEPYRAGRLGIAASLVRKQWLVREPDGSIRLSKETRLLLMEAP